MTCWISISSGKLQHLRHRVKRFLWAIRLALLDTNRLGGRLELHTVEVQMEWFDLLQAALGPHEYRGGALQLSMASDLKVILLLADECIIRIREIEPFVSVDAIMRHRTAEENRENRISPLVEEGIVYQHSQLFQALIAQHMPALLLERRESDALHRAWIISFRVVRLLLLLLRFVPVWVSRSLAGRRARAAATDIAARVDDQRRDRLAWVRRRHADTGDVRGRRGLHQCRGAERTQRVRLGLDRGQRRRHRHWPLDRHLLLAAAHQPDRALELVLDDRRGQMAFPRDVVQLGVADVADADDLRRQDGAVASGRHGDARHCRVRRLIVEHHVGHEAAQVIGAEALRAWVHRQQALAAVVAKNVPRAAHVLMRLEVQQCRSLGITRTF